MPFKTLSSGATHMLLLQRWDQRLLPPSRTNQQWQHLGHCLLCRRTSRSDIATPGQHMGSWSGWAVWDAKGHAFQTIPNSRCCSQPPLFLAKTLRGESWWHMKNRISSTSRNCHSPGCSARSALHTKNLVTSCCNICQLEKALKNLS